MADVNAEIGVNIDTSNALAQLKALQREIARFHASVAKSSEAAALAQRDLQKNFLNGINAIQGFSAELRTVKTTAENFTDSLERNKFSMREYFRYSMASTKTFGRFFQSELDTVSKVAEESVKRLQTQYIKMGRDATGAMKAIAVMPTKLNLDDFTTQTQLAAQKQAIFNQLVKQGSTNLLNFGKNTQWAGRQLMVGFTIPLVGLGTVASKTFMDMETAAIKFRKVYGDLFTTTAEREQALKDIEELADRFTKYGIAVSQTVGLAAEAAAAGFKGLDLQRQVTEATRLQVLGQVEQQKALETTISLQNAFRLSSEDLADSINFLNAVENQTVVSLDDITTAIPKAAPIVRELGGDVKDLAFFMAAMKEGGINASEGANALKSGLASLINPTDKAKGMLMDMGINIDRIVESNVGNLKATVIEFAQALDGLSNLQRQRAIEQLFGKFQQARLSALFDNVIRDGNQASRVLDLAGTSVEELASLAEQELGITANSAMFKFRKNVEDLKKALVPVGQLFLEIVTPFLENIGKILDKFNDLSAGTKKVIGVLTIGLGAIAPVVLMTVGLFANFVANGIKGLMLLRNGYLRLTGQSQILSQQTNFLSVEQQKALAAAASLEQSHMRLQQVFTGEATAIRALINEYQRMIIAQNMAATRFPGMMVPGFKPQGYANGVVSVPGPKGAGDVVPAMLSPGEAVISEAMNKKYAPLVQGIIADNIPGFKTGTKGSISAGKFGKDFGSLYGDVGRLYAAPPQILKQTEQVDWSTLDAERRAIIQKTREYLETLGLSARQIEEKLANLTRVQASHIEKQTFTTSIGGKDVQVKEWKATNLQADLGAVNNFLNVVPKIAKTLDEAKISEMAERLNISIDEFRSELAQLEEGIHPTTQKSADVLLEIAKEGSAIDPTLEASKVKRESLEKAKYQSIAAQAALEARKEGDYYGTLAERAYDPSKDFAAMQDINTRVSKVREQLLESFNISDEIAQLSGQNVQSLQSAWDQLSIEQQEGLLKLRDDIPGFTSALLEEAKNAGIAGFELGSSAIKGVAKGTAAASPSQEARRQGQNVADGFEQGILEGMDDVSVAGQRLSDAATQGIGITDLSQNIKFTQGTLPGMDVAASTNNVAEAMNNLEDTTIQTAEANTKSNAKLYKLNDRMMALSFSMSAISGVASAFGANMGGLSNIIFKLSSVMFALQAVIQAVTQAKLLELAASRLSTAQTAVKMAAGGGGIAGYGLAARGGLIGSIGKIGVFARTLLGLTGPIGFTISALTLLGGAYFALNKRAEANREKIDGLGNAALIAGDKLKTLDEIFGVDSKKFTYETFKFKGATAAPGIVSAREQSAQDLIENKKFQEDYSKTIKALKSATKQEAQLVLESLTMQLQARGYTKENIQSITDALIKEAGQTEVVLDFKKLDINTKEGQAELFKNINDSLNKYKADFAKGINDSYRKTLNLTAKTITGNLAVLKEQLSSGTLSAKDYVTQVANINTQILAMPDSAAKLNLVNSIFSTMGKDAENAASKVTDINNKLLLMQAMMLGQADEQSIINLSSPLAFVKESAIKTLTDNINKYFASLKKNIAEADKNASSGKGGGKALTLQEKLVAIYKKDLKLLDERLKKLRAVNEEISRQNEFTQNQIDLDKKIVEAKISGNYLEAAALAQQKLYNQAEFNRETQEIEIQKQIDKIEERISQLEERGNKTRITAAEKRLLGLENSKKKTIKTTEDAGGDQTKPVIAAKSADEARAQAMATGATSEERKGKPPAARDIPSPPKTSASPLPGTALVFDVETGKWERRVIGKIKPTDIRYHDFVTGKKSTYASGGLIKGPGTGTSDSILAMVDGYASGGMIRVSNGEYIFSKKAIDNAGGPKAIDAMHQRLRKAPAFKDGGEVKKQNWFQRYVSRLTKSQDEAQKTLSGSPFTSWMSSDPLGVGALLRKFAGQGRKGDTLAAALLPLNFMGFGLGNIGGTAARTSGMIASGASKARVAGQIGQKKKYRELIKSIYQRKDLDVGGYKYPSYSIGADPERIVFQGPRADLSEVSKAGIRVVPTTPLGILKEAIRRNPKDKSLQQLLKNFEENKIGKEETLLIDNLLAASTVTKTGRISGTENPDAFAMVLASLIGDVNATKILNAKREILYQAFKNKSEQLKEELLGYDKDAIAKGYTTPGPIDMSSVSVIHSTKFPVIRNPDGTVSLYPKGHFEAGQELGVPRASIHTTLEAPVQSHLYGQWGETDTRIISPLSSVIADNDVPHTLRSDDTWWMKGPGEALKMTNASIVRSFNDAKEYSEELIKRGLIKEGEKPPVIIEDPKTKEVLYAVKKDYTDEDRFEIAKIQWESRGSEYKVVPRIERFMGGENTSEGFLREFVVPDLLGKENSTLAELGLKFAKRQVGIDTPATSIAGWGLADKAREDHIKRIAIELRKNSSKPIHGAIHTGSPVEFMEKRYLTQSFEPMGFGDTKIDDSIEAARMAALHGNFHTGIRPPRSPFSEMGAMGGYITRRGILPNFAMGGYVNLASLPKFKTGISNVPYDMPAILHKNERVLTAEENKRYGETSSTINATFNITGGNSDEIVNKVMVKLNTLNNKNNKSNRVII